MKSVSIGFNDDNDLDHIHLISDFDCYFFFRENILNIITNLIQSLCTCSKLVTESELTKSASLLMSVPGVSQSSAIHPLSAAINSVLMEINASEFWDILVTGLIDVLKTQKLTELCGSTTDGFKVFLLSFLKSSENVWSSWVKKGTMF